MAFERRDGGRPRCSARRSTTRSRRWRTSRRPPARSPWAPACAAVREPLSDPGPLLGPPEQVADDLDPAPHLGIDHVIWSALTDDPLDHPPLPAQPRSPAGVSAPSPTARAFDLPAHEPSPRIEAWGGLVRLDTCRWLRPTADNPHAAAVERRVDGDGEEWPSAHVVPPFGRRRSTSWVLRADRKRQHGGGCDPVSIRPPPRASQTESPPAAGGRCACLLPRVRCRDTFPGRARPFSSSHLGERSGR